jgi:hypothetical protein
MTALGQYEEIDKTTNTVRSTYDFYIGDFINVSEIYVNEININFVQKYFTPELKHKLFSLWEKIVDIDTE